MSACTHEPYCICALRPPFADVLADTLFACDDRSTLHLGIVRRVIDPTVFKPDVKARALAHVMLAEVHRWLAMDRAVSAHLYR